MGGSLAMKLYGAEKIQWSLTALQKVTRGAAAGIAYLHTKSVIHRDIVSVILKYANV
jgi:serine/threonine protein kinase